MSIQLLNNNARQFKSNNSTQNRQQNNPVFNNTGDTVSFTAKEKNGFFKTLKSAALALPLALTPAGVNANLHPYLSPGLPEQMQTEAPPPANIQNPSPVESMPNEEAPAVDNEYLRVIACLKDTMSDATYSFPDTKDTVTLSFDKYNEPLITFQQKDKEETYAIDSLTGYIVYPPGVDEKLKSSYERMYEKLVQFVLESGKCDAYIQGITID